VIGNEVLDALPVPLVRWSGRGVVYERGVASKGSNFISGRKAGETPGLAELAQQSQRAG